MEEVQYHPLEGKTRRSSKRTYTVFTLLVISIFLGLASFTLMVKIFLYDQKMNGFRENIETGMQAMEGFGEKIQQGIASAVCPTIISRADWKAKPPKDRELMKTPVSFVIIHHTQMDECFTFEDCSAEMRKIQDFHQDKRGWSDIEYSYLIGGDGLVYEGRNWTTVGTHAPWYNDKSIGISFMGDFTEKVPNDAAIIAVTQLIQCALINCVLEPDYRMYGHRQVSSGTECPGDVLFQLIQHLPHWKPGDHFPPTQQVAGN